MFVEFVAGGHFPLPLLFVVFVQRLLFRAHVRVCELRCDVVGVFLGSIDW